MDFYMPYALFLLSLKEMFSILCLCACELLLVRRIAIAMTDIFFFTDCCFYLSIQYELIS